MKFNKWTLGLAAIGAVSLTSAARADEAKLSPIESATSGIVISGYVDVAAQYNMGNVNPASVTPAGTGGNALSSGSKIDSFSLNNITISIDKAQDESPWAAGYHVDLNYGSDAINGASSVFSGASVSGINNFGVRQAYVVVRTPIGNGIDWKFGVQDDIIGYEGNTDGANPNYTRSIGYSMEPTTLVGLIGTYKITDNISVSGGVANAVDAALYPAGVTPVSSKTLAASAALTAPDSWGFLKGGTLNVGTLLNLEKNGVNNYYAGIVVPTPMSKLKLGSSFDLISVANQGVTGFTAGNDYNDSGWVVGVYGNYQATDKLSLNLRGEYYDLAGVGYGSTTAYSLNGKGEEITATVAYNLWANVISRAEFRWDHVDSGTAFADGGAANSFLAAVNLIYTF